MLPGVIREAPENAVGAVGVDDSLNIRAFPIQDLVQRELLAGLFFGEQGPVHGGRGEILGAQCPEAGSAGGDVDNIFMDKADVRRGACGFVPVKQALGRPYGRSLFFFQCHF